MTKIIDFSTREEKSAGEKDTVESMMRDAAESETAKKADRALIVFEGDGFSEFWLQGISELELLWISEQLRIRALGRPFGEGL